MFIVNKHYDIIFCHNNGRRCYKRFSHEASVEYHRGQWERPRYAVNWFAKAFLKKPSAERIGPAVADAAPYVPVRSVGGMARGWRELLSLYRKNYVVAGIVFMLHNYATRDRPDIDRGARRLGRERMASARQGVEKSGWPRKSLSADRASEQTPSG